MNNYTIYSDGSCLNNPGPGGWAAIIINNNTSEREEISGGSKETTNNRMELLAAVKALEKIPAGSVAELFTDSAYLRKAFSEGWLNNWKRNGWLTQNKKSVANRDLWEELDKLTSKREIEFKWVKGHAGNLYNEWCDKLALAAAKKSLAESNQDESLEFLEMTTSMFGEEKNLPSARIKLARKLQMKKYRQEYNLFVAEGMRLCEVAASCADIEFGFYTSAFLKSERAAELVKNLRTVTEMHEIPSATFDKICDTQTPQGILVVARQKLFSADEILNKPLIIALDGVQDPGNVGTILRTAGAFNCGVILLGESADIFNSKVVRATMGAIFSVPTRYFSRREFLQVMKMANFEISAAVLDESAKIYFEHDFNKKSVIVLGSEADGVSKEIAKAAEKIFIPMPGNAESLNVSSAGAILISEAVRQRTI